MAFDAEFLEIMADVVEGRAPSSTNAYGKVTWGSSVFFFAKISRRTQKVWTTTEQNEPSTFTIWAPPGGYVATRGGVTHTTPTVTADWTFHLDGTWRPVIAIDAPHDEDGAEHHQKVMVK